MTLSIIVSLVGVYLYGYVEHIRECNRKDIDDRIYEHEERRGISK